MDAAIDALSMAAFSKMLPPCTSELCDAGDDIDPGCGSNQLVWKSYKQKTRMVRSNEQYMQGRFR